MPKKMIILLFIFLQIFLIESQEEKDIPVVEGNGGILKIQVEDEVQVLTSDNFDLIVLSKPLILVEFYAEWCHHCKLLAPEYSSAAKMLKEDNIPLAKVDAIKEENLSKRFGVSSFPTIFLFTNGTKEEYSGGRTALSIVEFMRQRADPNWKPPEETVITLNADNFDKTVEKEDLLLVEFYAPWCGHCKRLAPEYERAAKRLSQLEKPIKLGKVDSTQETEIAKRFEVNGYPTLFVFRKGKPFKYSGGRDETAIVEYMKSQTVLPSTLFDSVSRLKKSLPIDWPSIVGLFESESHPFFDVFIEAAFEERERNFRFFHSFDPKVISSLKENINSVIVFQSEFFSSKYEPKRYRLSMDSSVKSKDISYFIGNNSLPLVGLRTPTSQWIFQKFPLVVVYYDIDLSFEYRKQTQITRQQVLEVANNYKKKITFCVSKESDYLEELKDLKLDDSGEDVNVGLFMSSKVRYAMTPNEDFDSQILNDFVEDVLNGRVKPVIKSQPIPARNEGPVVVVVGETFESLVMKSEKNVLIEFYAEWCSHCQQLEPIYKQLAENLSSNKDLIIAKIDATLNDFPDIFQVNGFPTIYFLGKNDKNNAFLYSGDRSLEDINKFVNSLLFTQREEL